MVLRARGLLLTGLLVLGGCAARSEPAGRAPDLHDSRSSLDWAGAYEGVLPCADCPGIDTHLAINADGTFTLEETYRDRGAGHKSTGTWTIEEDGKRLLLDPDTKDAADRHFEIVSKDEVRMLDTEGKPIASELNYSLRRG